MDRRERYFHVHKTARDAYRLVDSFFSIRGDVVFANPHQAFLFLDALKAKSQNEAVQNLRPSELIAMGLIHEIFHAVIGLYRAEVKADVLEGAIGAAESGTGGTALYDTLERFVERFPPPSVYSGAETAKQFLAGSSEGVSNTQWVLEELILLWIGNQNPGYQPIQELVSDADLRKDTRYLDVISSVRAFFDAQPKFGPDKQNLIDMLLAPIRHSPSSVSGQLEFIRRRWGAQFSRLAFWSRLLMGLDFVVEEGLWFERKSHGVGGEDSLVAASFKGDLYEYEPEQFSQDLEWMPRVIMIAKSTFVWLDQLTKRYKRPIITLADIPEEEIETLARRGFTALWLIGLWRRSAASQRIKQIQGNHDAVASAYSLYDYEIAPELGGDDGWRILRDRCARRGMRLASDMVPNHMGIDSSWVINHPDWFIQMDHPPYPSYSFNGPDLSTDPRVGIFIEDGYWSRSDAAVVFKRLDRWTGSAKYIYHGNDGTSMPWNDTAQLDYLKAEVREAVIQTILHVARRFPVIRFDAAMTLAKRHYQRLWFPLPGTGGAIPSRSQFAMSKEDFDRVFPVEFWREVVDRVAAEVPNTLLLAEAFWLMEGYFVRTLGMHRVYNSAFMNMLKKEENSNFRLSIRNVLEFNPQILKRHVNFMNNPDEDTAVAQFGKDDKYFGVCTMMCTMPGLPMFGHGQVEGFTEKYGMEFKRAMWDEAPDAWLVARHEREIFPLLRRRYLFSDVENFLMYDFVTPGGWVDEDVFAYSNRAREERALVFYHNKFKDTRGTIRMSVGFLDPGGTLVQRSLGEGLGLPNEQDCFLIFRDHVTGLEYLRESRDLIEHGFEVELQAFKYKVFVDFREVRDSPELPYRKLLEMLGARGVPSIVEALVDLRFRPIHEPLYEAINPKSLEYLSTREEGELPFAELEKKLQHIVDGIAYFEGKELELASDVLADFSAMYEVGVSLLSQEESIVEKLPMTHVFLMWLYCEAIGEIHAKVEKDAVAAYVVNTWRLDRPIQKALAETELDAGAVKQMSDLLTLLVRNGDDLRTLEEAPFERMARLIEDVEVASFLGVHAYEGILWFNKEAFDDLVAAVGAIARIERMRRVGEVTRERIREIERKALQKPVDKVAKQRSGEPASTPVEPDPKKEIAETREALGRGAPPKRSDPSIEPNEALARGTPRPSIDPSPEPSEASAPSGGEARIDPLGDAIKAIQALGEGSKYQFVLLKRDLLDLAAAEAKPKTTD